MPPTRRAFLLTLALPAGDSRRHERINGFILPAV